MHRYAQMAAATVLILFFGGAGVAKLINPEMFYDQFARFGLPDWFVLVTGAVELLAAALMAFFNDLRRRLGAVMVAATMAVATSLHLAHDPLPMAAPAFLLMLLAGYLALVPPAQRGEQRRTAA